MGGILRIESVALHACGQWLSSLSNLLKCGVVESWCKLNSVKSANKLDSSPNLSENKIQSRLHTRWTQPNHLVWNGWHLMLHWLLWFYFKTFKSSSWDASHVSLTKVYTGIAALLQSIKMHDLWSLQPWALKCSPILSYLSLLFCCCLTCDHFSLFDSGACEAVFLQDIVDEGALHTVSI